MSQRDINLRETKTWSFYGESVFVSPTVCYITERVSFSCVVTNDGLDKGTVYLRFKLIDSYTREIRFDTHTNLVGEERAALRIVDINVGQSKSLEFGWVIPGLATGRHYDVCLQIWNPHLLFDGLYSHMFFDSGWLGAFESVETPVKGDIFISYSHDDEIHKGWVRKLADKLRRRYKVIIDQYCLLPGDQLALFMEQGINESLVRILICTSNYVEKADARKAGGVGFETILSATQYMNYSIEERRRVIPVVRSSTRDDVQKTPRYISGSLYVDMTGDDWDGKAFSDLLTSIDRCLA